MLLQVLIPLVDHQISFTSRAATSASAAVSESQISYWPPGYCLPPGRQRSVAGLCARASVTALRERRCTPGACLNRMVVVGHRTERLRKWRHEKEVPANSPANYRLSFHDFSASFAFRPKPRALAIHPLNLPPE